VFSTSGVVAARVAMDVNNSAGARETADDADGKLFGQPSLHRGDWVLMGISAWSIRDNAWSEMVLGTGALDGC
jgi:hypothetical protein